MPKNVKDSYNLMCLHLFDVQNFILVFCQSFFFKFIYLYFFKIVVIFFKSSKSFKLFQFFLTSNFETLVHSPIHLFFFFFLCVCVFGGYVFGVGQCYAS